MIQFGNSQRNVSRRRTRRFCIRQSAWRRRGAMTLLMLMLLIGLLAAAAFSVDVAYMQLVRTELRRATDSAARAGCEALARTSDPAAARNAAREAAALNIVASVPLQLSDDEIEVGHCAEDRHGTWVFMADAEPYNSVRIVGSRKDGSAGGRVNLFFGSVIGTSTFAPSLSATVMINTDVQRDFCVVVDRSGSMNNRAGGRSRLTRWQALLSSYDSFLEELADTNDREQIGLVSYSTFSAIENSLSNRYDDSSDRLHDLYPAGTTNIYSGIQNGVRVLTDTSRARKKADKVMIVMTDGLHNTGPEPILAADAAAAEGITIYTITFGDEADLDRMKKVADKTGGRHYHAPTVTDLREAFIQVVTDSGVLSFAE